MISRKFLALILIGGAFFALSPGRTEAACTGIGQFQGSCTPYDFVFSPATTDTNMRGYFWGRCAATTATGADSKYNPANGSGTDNGSNVGFGTWFTWASAANSGNYRANGSGWAYLGTFDGCPAETNGDCNAGNIANSETLWTVMNSGEAATNPLKITVGGVRYIDATQFYDIDAIAGGATPPLCVQTCQVTTNGGSSWASCAGGASMTPLSYGTAGASSGFFISSSDKTAKTATLSWTHPTVRANVAGFGYPISSWGVFRIDSAAAPTSFASSSWTEVARFPGNVNSGTFTYSATAPTNRYYFALVPRFDGNGGLGAGGVACSVLGLAVPAAACQAISTNTFDPLGTGIMATPKVGPSTTTFILPTATTGGFVETSASYDSLQKVTIGYTTTDETGVTGFNVSRGTGPNPVTWTKITSSPMAAKGMPSTYSFTDTTLPRQRTYGVFTYKVEAIGGSGEVLFEIRIQVTK